MSVRTQDAINRAARTIWQFVIVDVLLVVVPLLMDSLEGEDPVQWGRLWRTAARAGLGGGLAYLMRLRLPPPTPDGAP